MERIALSRCATTTPSRSRRCKNSRAPRCVQEEGGSRCVKAYWRNGACFAVRIAPASLSKPTEQVACHSISRHAFFPLNSSTDFHVFYAILCLAPRSTAARARRTIRHLHLVMECEASVYPVSAKVIARRLKPACISRSRFRRPRIVDSVLRKQVCRQHAASKLYLRSQNGLTRKRARRWASGFGTEMQVAERSPLPVSSNANPDGSLQANVTSSTISAASATGDEKKNARRTDTAQSHGPRKRSHRCRKRWG